MKKEREKDLSGPPSPVYNHKINFVSFFISQQAATLALMEQKTIEKWKKYIGKECVKTIQFILGRDLSLPQRWKRKSFVILSSLNLSKVFCNSCKRVFQIREANSGSTIDPPIILFSVIQIFPINE